MRTWLLAVAAAAVLAAPVAAQELSPEEDALLGDIGPTLGFFPPGLTRVQPIPPPILPSGVLKNFQPVDPCSCNVPGMTNRPQKFDGPPPGIVKNFAPAPQP
jgi:hypothetical protein